jgi:hypothetical protein
VRSWRQAQQDRPNPPPPPTHTSQRHIRGERGWRGQDYIVGVAQATIFLAGIVEGPGIHNKKKLSKRIKYACFKKLDFCCKIARFAYCSSSASRGGGGGGGVQGPLGPSYQVTEDEDLTASGPTLRRTRTQKFPEYRTEISSTIVVRPVAHMHYLCMHKLTYRNNQYELTYTVRITNSLVEQK